MASPIARGIASSFLKQRLRGGSTPKMIFSLLSHPKLFYSPTSFRSLIHTLTPESDSSSCGHDCELADAGYPKYAFLPYDNPLLKSGSKKLFEMKMDDDAAWLRMDMPGVNKEGLKVWFESDVLKIKGFEANPEEGLKEEPRKYFAAIEIGEMGSLKKEETVANLKDGVLKLVIPKLKLEEEKDIINVIIT